ncbi:CAF17-like 4Fe-4S cluster assembly/insertion protein YgfZ [Gordonia hydrophobica]|uniref:Folate-binding protein YgfZ n=1 Tax=Gordonia hydrophobica TaxID=40516 RepID=A0ABZ2U5W5_9ACTN|nr:folate-binding protein YgfZ [Gordonia hydrophobica]MBM7367861.1 folate-binding protein YgfZ [Gordonia hydrophobica]
MPSPSPILTSHPGAVPTPEGDPSPGVAWHYGDPLGEQRAATRRAAIVDRSDRAVIELSGDERLTWLHTISTQHLTGLADRRSAENLSLDGNGRIEDHFVLTDIDGTTWVDTESSRGESLADFLTKMVFWAKVTPAARPDMAVLTLLGPDVLSGPIAEAIGLAADATVYQAGDLPELRHDDEPLGFWRVMPSLGDRGTTPVVDLVVPESDVRAWWKLIVDAGAAPAGMWTYEALRVAAMRPRLHLDTDERTIPHEVDWIGGPDEGGAVHLDKGCYRGQETVARVANLGRPPRRLVLLHLDGSSAYRPTTGDDVNAGGRKIGRLGTVVDHFENGLIALALVKRNVPVDTELVVGAPDSPDDAATARIDPDLYTPDDQVQPGRAAVDRLRGRG